ncbi:MAG: restriction endonuclease [Lachnoclostridium sp.]|nr:restriction endonuclease [Lachnoclostridium sp.]
MDSNTFNDLLYKEILSYKSFLETADNDWIVKGFIDVNKNIYTITNDTKVVSKIIEILLIPKLENFAKRNNLILELPSKQNYYPDLTFKDNEGSLFAVDFKSSYYDGAKANGLTLGSYWGYFRNRTEKMSMDYPYSAYKCHIVVGILYQQAKGLENEKTVYSINQLEAIKSVIDNFIFFVQPKWKIALDRPGSGNTRNIGGTDDITKLINGTGPFAELGEDVFDDYWMNYYNKADAKLYGPGTPNYYNLESYKAYKTNQTLLDKLK